MKLTREEILAKLRTLLVEITGCNPDDVVPEAWLMQTTNTPSPSSAPVLGVDSLDFIEIIMAIEEEFSLDIPDEDSEKIETVAQVIDYIEGDVA